MTQKEYPKCIIKYGKGVSSVTFILSHSTSLEVLQSEILFLFDLVSSRAIGLEVCQVNTHRSLHPYQYP